MPKWLEFLTLTTAIPVFSLFYNRLHCLDGYELTHIVVTVYNGGNRCFKNYFGFCIYMDKALFYSLMIAHQALHSVGFDTVYIG